MTDVAAVPTPLSGRTPAAIDLANRPAAASAIATLLDAHAHAREGERRRRTRLHDAVGRSPLTDETRPLFARARAELTTAHELGLLGSDWATLHAVPLGGRETDIPNLVIGPAGVFVISSQLHSKAVISTGRSQVFTDGQAQPYVASVLSAAERTSQLLTAALQAVSPLSVRPVLAFAAAKSFEGKESVDGVALVATERLAAWLLAQPVVWRADAVAQVLEAARSADTWKARPIDPWRDTADRTAFTGLQRHITLMWRVAWAWRCGCLAAGLAGIWALISALA